MIAAVVRVESFTDYIAVSYQDRADDRIGMCESLASPGESERAKHQAVIRT